MSILRRFIFVSSLCCVFSVAFAQGVSGILVPREVFVGDTAEFSFTLSSLPSAPGSKLGDSLPVEDSTVFTVPAGEIPETSEVTIESIVIAKNASALTVSIRFVPWIPGDLQLPSFAYKDIRITPPLVRIGSILEKTGYSSLSPERPPLLVPGTTWFLYALIAAVIALLIVGGIAVRKLARYFLSDPLTRQSGARVRILLRELKNFERNLSRLNAAAWYSGFAIAGRKYLGAFCFGNIDACRAFTGSEISSAVREKLLALEVPREIQMALSDRVSDLFSTMDKVRFGGEGLDCREGFLAKFRLLVGDLEKARLEAEGRKEAAHVQS
jgi:hypothetical protein